MSWDLLNGNTPTPGGANENTSVHAARIERAGELGTWFKDEFTKQLESKSGTKATERSVAVVGIAAAIYGMVTKVFPEMRVELLRDRAMSEDDITAHEVDAIMSMVEVLLDKAEEIRSM